MNTTTPIPPLFKKIRPPVKTHGGKYYLAMQLRDAFTAAMSTFGDAGMDVYASVFGGGYTDGLNAPDAGQVPIYNDLDPVKVNLFERLRDDADFLRTILAAREYNEREFILARILMTSFINVGMDEIRTLAPSERTALAAAYVVSSRFSRGGMGKSFAWSDRERGGMPGDLNAWLTFLRDDYDRVAARCRRLVTLCGGYAALCKSLADDAFDGKRVVAYFDPPYVRESRTARKAYGKYELPTFDPPDCDPLARNSHDHLLDCILAIDAEGGRVVVSGYRSALYDQKLQAFKRDDHDFPNNSGQGETKERRVECIWRNF